MALTESPLRAPAVPLIGPRTPAARPVPVSAFDAARIKPSYDGSPAAYRRLRSAVIEAGLLDRRYGYYAWRISLSFAFLAAAAALAFVVPAGWIWTTLVILALGFGFAQVAMVGHDSGH